MNNKLGKPLEDLQTDDMIRLFGSSISEKDLEDPESREIILAFLNDIISGEFGEIEHLVYEIYFDINTLLISVRFSEDANDINLLKYKIDKRIHYLDNYKNESPNMWNIIDFKSLEDKYIKISYDSSNESYIKELLSIDNLLKVKFIDNILEEILKYEKF